MLTLFVFTDLCELISSLIVDAQSVMARALRFFLSVPKQREIVTRSLRFVGLNRPATDLFAVGGSLATALLIAIALVALPTRMAAQDQARNGRLLVFDNRLTGPGHFRRQYFCRKLVQ